MPRSCLNILTVGEKHSRRFKHTNYNFCLRFFKLADILLFWTTGMNCGISLLKLLRFSMQISRGKRGWGGRKYQQFVYILKCLTNYSESETCENAKEIKTVFWRFSTAEERSKLDLNWFNTFSRVSRIRKFDKFQSKSVTNLFKSRTIKKGN